MGLLDGQVKYANMRKREREKEGVEGKKERKEERERGGGGGGRKKEGEISNCFLNSSEACNTQNTPIFLRNNCLLKFICSAPWYAAKEVT